jgi:retron-type reverse transcriptase
MAGLQLSINGRFWVSTEDERVKANQGAAGVDSESIEAFEQDLKNNLYKIWNRMSSGTYFPPAVRTVAIPKKDGGERRLGIPTVAASEVCTRRCRQRATAMLAVCLGH